jgi:hypothetical protein
MTITKEQFLSNILLLAKKVNQEENFKNLMNTYPGLPKIIEMLVYMLFLNDYENYIEKDNNIFNAYNSVKEYSKELNKNGFVIFK